MMSAGRVGSDEPWTVRRAVEGDIGDLVRLRLAMLAELNEIDDSEMEGTVAANRRYFREKLPDGEFIAFLAEAEAEAEAEGEIVATSGLAFWERPPTSGSPGIDGYIMNMYTVPEWRGRGIASALLERLVHCAQEAGARRVFLRAVSPEGRRIYQQLGFVGSDTYMERRP
jgi:GNAT superfamily N-acetyltransferase